MLILSAADLRTVLPMNVAIAAMREAFGLLDTGRAELPLRTSLHAPEPGGLTLVMPARCDVSYGLGAKLVSVVPGNPAKRLPLVQAIVVLLEADSGRPAALLEGTTLTAIRTGAASGLATELLARPDAVRVAILGSGAQARTQLEAVCAVREIAEVAVWSRTRAHAERFAADMAGQGRVPRAVQVVPSAAAAVAEADVVCTATSSPAPLLTADEIRPGTHVNAVGSFTPRMQELDPRLLGRAYLVVDQRAAALAEAGEVIAAAGQGLVGEDELVELGAIVNGRAPGRRSADEITVFKSVGIAVQDICAGARAVAEALRQGVGTVVDL